MTIRYKCDECGAVLNIKDELAGTQGHCPRCQVEFTVPAAEGNSTAEKEAAAVAGESAAERSDRPTAGGFSEDDIGDILASQSPVSSTTKRRGTGNSFDAEDENEEPDDEPPKKRRKPDLSDDHDDDESADDEQDDDSRRRPKKKGKRSVKAEPKADSAESASIARTLMGRGDHVAHDEKKAGRPFGGTDGRGEERRDYTKADIVKYIASIGWPAAVGLVVFAGLCWFIFYLVSPKLNLPPLAEVTGTVTFDSKPLEKAIVKFMPVVEGAKPNLNLGTSFGVTDENGKYSLTYMVIDQKIYTGAVIGKHIVTIQATDKQGLDLLPARYSHTSGGALNKEVVKGGPPINFDLKSDPETPSQ